MTDRFDLATYLTTVTSRNPVVRELARRVRAGEVWRLDRANSSLSAVDRAALAAAEAELREAKRSRRSPKPAKRASAAPRTAAAPRCTGCGNTGGRTIRLRIAGTDGVETWHERCRDAKRFGAEAVRGRGDGLRIT